MTVKQALHDWIEQLTEQEASDLLAQVEDAADVPLTAEELERVLRGEEQIARGDVVDGDELLRELGF